VDEFTIGGEILELLKRKVNDDKYHNPIFLAKLTELIEDFYEIEDDSVDAWIQEMYGQ
jgi:hypothetical protein